MCITNIIRPALAAALLSLAACGGGNDAVEPKTPEEPDTSHEIEEAGEAVGEEIEGAAEDVENAAEDAVDDDVDGPNDDE